MSADTDAVLDVARIANALERIAAALEIENARPVLIAHKHTSMFSLTEAGGEVVNHIADQLEGKR